MNNYANLMWPGIYATTVSEMREVGMIYDRDPEVVARKVSDRIDWDAWGVEKQRLDWRAMVRKELNLAA